MWNRIGVGVALLISSALAFGQAAAQPSRSAAPKLDRGCPNRKRDVCEISLSWLASQSTIGAHDPIEVIADQESIIFTDSKEFTIEPYTEVKCQSPYDDVGASSLQPFQSKPIKDCFAARHHTDLAEPKSIDHCFKTHLKYADGTKLDPHIQVTGSHRKRRAKPKQ